MSWNQHVRYDFKMIEAKPECAQFDIEDEEEMRFINRAQL